MRCIDFTELTIETDRLRLSPISDQFREERFQEFTAEIAEFMYPKPHDTIDGIDEWTTKSRIKMKKGEDYTVMVLRKDTREFLGCGGLHNPHTKHPELGIWIKKLAHGNNYGREAVTALKNWADEHLDYEYITYPVDKRNIASRKIAESLGGKIGKEYRQKNIAGKELDEVEYWIYKDKKSYG